MRRARSTRNSVRTWSIAPGPPSPPLPRWPLAESRPRREVLRATCLQLGSILDPGVFLSEWTAYDNVSIALDFESKSLQIRFCHLQKKYKLETMFKHINPELSVSEEENSRYAIIVPVMFPARSWVLKPSRPANDTEQRWEQKEKWERVVTIPLGSGSDISEPEPLTLHPTDRVVRLGKWIVYRVELRLSYAERQRFNQVLREAADNNLVEYDFAARAPIYKFFGIIKPLDLPDLYPLDPTAFFPDPKDFDIIYRLESLISQDFLHERNLNVNFYRKLASLPKERAVSILESFAARKRRVFSPYANLQDLAARLLPIVPTVIPPYCVMARKVIVTPTTIYVLEPTMETSNRVLRHYRHVQDRFLRVQFVDEAGGKVGASDYDSDINTELYARIYSVLKSGLKIGDRVYEFLASSNSQLREHASWFFAPTPDLSSDQIREWMGDFSKEKTVAKNAARMGQCFSSTRFIDEVTEIREIPDIYHNNFNFSDGVGKISLQLATKVAERLQLTSVPSAFQFRLGGAKGVLCVSNYVKGNCVELRPSQIKFKSPHAHLEIIKTSTFTSAHLNRQVITLLTTLGIPDKIFLDRMAQTIKRLDQMLGNPQVAIDFVLKHIDKYGTARAMASMVRAGFLERADPYIQNLIRLFRVMILKDLKGKAKIHVPDGAYLLGVLDETVTLKEDEIFVQITDPDDSSKLKTIVGDCIVLRVPCFHPGDVRTVKAVECPKLSHLKDVLVFPADGYRDLPSMCSGGDLDGDEFTVIWDTKLIPKTNYPPHEFKGSPPTTVKRVTMNKIKNFFVQYIKNDNLGMIANAHLALADQSPLGALEGHCLRLAGLHSVAVDFPKTGIPAIFERECRATAFPDFMEKPDKPSYESEKVLGVIYRSIQASDYESYESTLSYDLRFDCRIIVPGFEQFVPEARTLKFEYDHALRSLRNQYGIATEFELVSGYIMNYLQSGHKREFERREQVMDSSAALRAQFVDKFEEEFAGKTDVTYARKAKAAAWYYVTYHPWEIQHAATDGPIMFSFPWLMSGLLCEIATGDTRKRDERTADMTEFTIDALRRMVEEYHRERSEGSEGSDYVVLEDEIYDEMDEDDDDFAPLVITVQLGTAAGASTQEIMKAESRFYDFE
ncbi:RNA dependent RNA polymerase-domain-containing protein [Jimgerdemannia flammicorona]|uniref:RNA-dependent RNA polymerase n=1 Tax=Jimgerdemannia flammicorona TaxID=994334 RepID=A0A433QB52_9FUNG|nr:RNA dependent RNA polymerase-domain-containing protein [Jimgerdemannia flammicorona]